MFFFVAVGFGVGVVKLLKFWGVLVMVGNGGESQRVARNSPSLESEEKKGAKNQDVCCEKMKEYRTWLRIFFNFFVLTTKSFSSR